MSHLPLRSDAPGKLGELLRYWRGVRRKSQLELAADARTTPRYVSFVETGRAQPSRRMVVRLAAALDVPLRERNHLFLAAGYAPMFPREPLDAPQLHKVEAAVAAMLDQHEPFPAVLLDRGWNVRRANRGARYLFGRLLAPQPVPEPANVLRLMIGPGPVRRGVLNWPVVVPALLDRAHREAVGGVVDGDTSALIAELRALPEVDRLFAEPAPVAPSVPVIDIRFQVDGTAVGFFSVVSTIGTPVDVTAQELRVEAFFPADDGSGTAWRRLHQTDNARQ